VPESEANRTARRKRTREEAKALEAAGKPLEQKHLTALGRGKAKSSKVQTDINEAVLSRDTSIHDDPKFGAASKVLRQMGQHKAAFSAIGYQPRDVKSNTRAINDDRTHHAQMATVGDILQEKLDKAHDSGLIPAVQVKKSLDKDLLTGHNSLEKSEIAHDKGYVDQAKEHMLSAKNAYYKVAVSMGSRGVPMKNDTHKVVENIASAYVNSKVPGRGAAPHEGFKSNKISNVPYKAPKFQKETGSTKDGKAISNLSKSYESFTPDISSFNDEKEPEATSGRAMSQQLQQYFDGR
jgi:hypothetical protein